MTRLEPADTDALAGLERMCTGRILKTILCYSRAGVGNVVGMFPRSFRLVVAHPIDEVLRLAPPEFGGMTGGLNMSAK